MKDSRFMDMLRYRFDKMMSRGTVALVGILFLVTAIVVIIAGIISFAMGEGSMAEHIWISIMHVIDPGTITGDETDDRSFLLVMSVVTLCGIFITSILISIITTGFKEKLSSLKKGSSRVMEKGHTLILGFNENAHTIISELIKAGPHNNTVVILAEDEVESIEDEVRKRVGTAHSMDIICRTGSISDSHMLRQCSVDTCKSVIINTQNDFTVTQTLLAINNYFSTEKNAKMNAHVVASVCDSENYDAICIAGGSYVEPVLVSDTIARIIAQSCRQPGISNVLLELFGFGGNELYFKCFPKLAKKKFGEVLNMFEDGVVMGINRDGKIMLNPRKDIELKSDDELVIFCENDENIKYSRAPVVQCTDKFLSAQPHEKSQRNILILGTNEMLGSIITELDNYFQKGSKIILADKVVDEKYINMQEKLLNMQISAVDCDINKRGNIRKLLDNSIDHVVLLSADDCSTSESDAMTLLKLIHLRDIAGKQNKNFSITSEMKNTVNQKLAQVAKVNDLVVGSDIINLILTQISQNRALSRVFRELLHAEGCEIYLRSVNSYFKADTMMDFYTITEIVKNKNEIVMGYKRQIGDTFEIVTNPKKSEKIMLTKEDYLIILSV